MSVSYIDLYYSPLNDEEDRHEVAIPSAASSTVVASSVTTSAPAATACNIVIPAVSEESQKRYQNFLKRDLSLFKQGKTDPKYIPKEVGNLIIDYVGENELQRPSNEKNSTTKLYNSLVINCIFFACYCSEELRLEEVNRTAHFDHRSSMEATQDTVNRLYNCDVNCDNENDQRNNEFRDRENDQLVCAVYRNAIYCWLPLLCCLTIGTVATPFTLCSDGATAAKKCYDNRNTINLAGSPQRQQMR